MEMYKCLIKYRTKYESNTETCHTKDVYLVLFDTYCVFFSPYKKIKIKQIKISHDLHTTILTTVPYNIDAQMY